MDLQLISYLSGLSSGFCIGCFMMYIEYKAYMKKIDDKISRVMYELTKD